MRTKLEEPKFLPILALVGAAFIGAIMGVFARELAQGLTVVEQVALRSLLGAAVLLCICWRVIDLGKIRTAPRQDLYLTTARAVAMFVVAISLGTIAFVEGNYASVAIVMALPTPAVLSIVMFGERMSVRDSMFVALAFTGAALTILAGTGLGTGIGLTLDGPLLCALVATLFMSWGILSRKWQSPHLTNYETTFLMLLVAGLVMAIAAAGWCLWTGRVPGLSLYLLGVGTVAGLANIGFLLATNYAIPQLRGVVTNNLLALQPVFGAVVGVIMFGEVPTAFGLVGCLFILVAVLAIANPTLLSRRGAVANMTGR
ncbi:DMT family transporter [Consotaella aegiceratis]|uniref:DMT family transporter n=1 Tax=Consotaella aegiceratis TaxID=3097961 RepID=UPI002F3F142D